VSETSKPANNANYFCTLLLKVLTIKSLLSLPWIHFHQSSHLASSEPGVIHDVVDEEEIFIERFSYGNYFMIKLRLLVLL
jgi:hypothetical protein